MDKLVSVILPARNEQYLATTIRDVLAKAQGEIEVLPVLDDYRPEEFVQDERVRYLTTDGHGKRHGMNVGASEARGDYLFFLDAHCMVGEGFDVILKEDCDDDWIATPSRYKLEPEAWTILEDDRYPVEAMYICYPPRNPNKPTLDGFPWRDRAAQRKEILIDDDMVNQGSACFMTASHYQRMGFMDTANYGGNFQEAQETCLKTWLMGGRVIRNKRTWYAHWRKKHRGWPKDDAEIDKGVAYSCDFWMNNRLEGRVHDLEWLIEKFAPVPTWRDGWREHWDSVHG